MIAEHADFCYADDEVSNNFFYSVEPLTWKRELVCVRPGQGHCVGSNQTRDVYIVQYTSRDHLFRDQIFKGQKIRRF